jgi:hypothetical protein
MSKQEVWRLEKVAVGGSPTSLALSCPKDQICNGSHEYSCIATQKLIRSVQIYIAVNDRSVEGLSLPFQRWIVSTFYIVLRLYMTTKGQTVDYRISNMVCRRSADRLLLLRRGAHQEMRSRGAGEVNP